MLALFLLVALPHVHASAVLEQVTRINPRLVEFAGSESNYRNLVYGLAHGAAIVLTTPRERGLPQTVVFDAESRPMPPAEVAHTLELARQRLLGEGVAAPTAPQISNALLSVVDPPAGGPLPLPARPYAGSASATGN